LSDTLSYTVKTASAQMLGALSGLLAKAKTHFSDTDVEDKVWINARLYPDMHPLTRQVQISCDSFARGAARLAGADIPSFPDTETTADELIARVNATQDFVSTLDSAAMDANERELLSVPLGPMTVEWEGRQYLTTFMMPNFHFHVSMTYALLRHQGVAVGKRDFLGL